MDTVVDSGVRVDVPVGEGVTVGLGVEVEVGVNDGGMALGVSVTAWKGVDDEAMVGSIVG